MLKQRVITAAILIPLTLLIVFYLPAWAFCIVTGIITLGAAWEWSKLMGLENISSRLSYVGLIALILIAALFIHTQIIFFIASLWWCIAFLLIILYSVGRQSFLRSKFIRGVIGVFVLTPCWVAINYMRNERDGFYAIVFLFVLVFGADSVAYFTGRKWGKHFIAPKVSPGKSLQGVVGACLFAIIVTLFTSWLIALPINLWMWCGLLSLVTVVFSVIGDLFESMLKRNVALKDSGGILPGHGGILDRIDSLTAAAPIFVMGTLLLSKYFD